MHSFIKKTPSSMKKRLNQMSVWSTDQSNDAMFSFLEQKITAKTRLLAGLLVTGLQGTQYRMQK
jgi:hypothetical protein